jgi:REP element-mobilizing transposase RayT
MKNAQQGLPFRFRGGARKGAGRKRKAARPQVPHRPRGRFRNGALHVTVRVRQEVWNLRTHRCFRALRRSFERGCDRFGFRLIHFSVQGNHIHCIVEAPDVVALGRAMKGLEVRMARALNKVMERRGAVFADRYHAHLLRSPREAAHAVRYALENWRVHALRDGRPAPAGVDPWCSAAWLASIPRLVCEPEWWMLRVGVGRLRKDELRAA